MPEAEELLDVARRPVKSAILVVEDDPGVATLERRRLERAGYEVLTSASAEEALEKIQHNDVELIVLDQGLPDATGLEFYKRLKAGGHVLPVIMVTGLSDEAMVIEALRAGVRDYITKSPEYLDYLPEAVERVLKQVRMEQRLEESEEKYRSIFENALEGILQSTPEGRIVMANPAIARILGYSSPEALIASVTDIRSQLYLDPDRRETLSQQLEQCGEVSAFEIPVRHQDGSEIWLSVNARAVRGSSGRVELFESTFEDITARKQAEVAKARLAAIVESSEDAILGKSLDGMITSWNRGAEQLYGYTAEEMVGRHVSILAPPERYDEITRILEKLKRGEKVERLETVRVTKGGRRLDVSLTNSPIFDSGGNVVGASAITRDITERKAFEEQLRHQALHDPLTDLPNRALFIDRLEHALERAPRSKGQVAVLFLDLDNFKVVNDSLGHLAGDQLLVSVAARLRSCLRPGDTVARLGGDEFTVLIEGASDAAYAARVSERIIEVLRKPFFLDGQEMIVGASIGIALINATFIEHGSAEGLMRDADIAMYEAKRRGKSRYVVFEDAMNNGALERLNLERDLRRALERGEYRVHYQPTVSLEDKSTVGFEALVRWKHPKRGLVLPEEFIPLAEESGLIVPLGLWVLGEACRQAKQWQRYRPSNPPLMMSVNLSVRQFEHRELVEDITRVLQETGLEPNNLNLEITESVAMRDALQSARIMQELKELGVALSIDDFGTGYSSVSYLQRVPADYLKIDRSFISRLDENPEDKALVKAIVGMARALEMKIVAEGVETATQCKEIWDLGCDYGQGYYFSKPLPAGEALKVLS